MPDKRPSLDELKHTQKSEGAAPEMDLVTTHGVVKESQVDILLMQAPRENLLLLPTSDNFYIRVKLWSKRRPELNSYSDIYCKGKTKAEVATACEFVAAGLAERQITLYMDSHDPYTIAKEAKKGFLALMSYLETHRARPSTAPASQNTMAELEDALSKQGGV